MYSWFRSEPASGKNPSHTLNTPETDIIDIWEYYSRKHRIPEGSKNFCRGLNHRVFW